MTNHDTIDPDGAPHTVIAGVAVAALASAILAMLALAMAPAHLAIGALALATPPSLLAMARRARRLRDDE